MAENAKKKNNYLTQILLVYDNINQKYLLKMTPCMDFVSISGAQFLPKKPKIL